MLVDSHCHLNLLDLTQNEGELEPFINRAQEQGISHFLNVSVNLTDFPEVLQTAKAYPFVSASVGLHPNDDDEDVNEATLLALAQDTKVVAIGETGLDYFRSSQIEKQHQRFRLHIAVAKQLKKPLIIHTRQAQDDTLAILKAEKADDVGGVMHCFTEDWAMAEAALKLNFYISISGIVTFKNAAQIKEVAQKVPLNRLLIETDAPYLAPEPFRGKPNEPAYLRRTAEYIANLRGVTFEQLAKATTQNYFELFKGALTTHV